MCTVRLFSQGAVLFVLKFYLDRVVSQQRYLASENYRDTAGLPDGKTASFCVPSFRHNTGV